MSETEQGLVEVIKEENVSLADLEKELYKYPPTSEDYYTVRRKFINLMKNGDAKYKKYLIAIPSMINPEYHKRIDAKRPAFTNWEIFNNYTGKHGLFTKTDCGLDGELLSDSQTFVQDEDFLYPARWEIEFNPFYKQLVVGVYITDGVNIVLLKTHKDATRLSEKYTMVQGHVEFEPSIYVTSQLQYIRQQAIRELEEETNIRVEDMYVGKGLVKLEFPEAPKYYSNISETHIDIEHVGMLYELRVANIDATFPNLASGEEHTHDVVIMNMREAISNPEITLDSWVRALIKTLLDEK